MGMTAESCRLLAT